MSQGGGEGDEAPYARLVRAHPTDGEIVFDPDPAKTRELFADAPAALFPVIGQVTQPGRDFQPAARAVEVRALFDRDEIAFLVSWHDMTAERSGENRPDMESPTVAERDTGHPAGAASLWNEGAPATAGAAQPEAGAATEPAGDDFWGTEVGGSAQPAAEPAAETSGGGDDFWGGGGGGESATAPAAAPAASPWADAVALQFPAELRPGVAKPYFLFGDADYPVELWHVELGTPPRVRVYEGRGSRALTELDREPPQVVAGYDKGRWTVAFKRPRVPEAGVPFPESSFVPLAVTVWDGFHHERGNTRGLTRWFHVYVPPLAAPSPVVPMVEAGAGVLAAELLLVLWVRRRAARTAAVPVDDRPSRDRE